MHSSALAETLQAEVKPDPDILRLAGMRSDFRIIRLDETADNVEILLQYLCPELANPKDLTFAEQLQLFEIADRYGMGMLRELVLDKMKWVQTDSDQSKLCMTKAQHSSPSIQNLTCTHAALLFACAVRTKESALRQAAERTLVARIGTWDAKRAPERPGEWLFSDRRRGTGYNFGTGRFESLEPARVQMEERTATDLFLLCAMSADYH